MASLLRMSLHSKGSSRQAWSLLAGKNKKHGFLQHHYYSPKIRALTSPPHPPHFVPILACGSLALVHRHTKYMTTRCESTLISGHAIDSSSDFARVYQRALEQKHKIPGSKYQRMKHYAGRALRMALRAFMLMCTLAPVVAFYPVQGLLRNNSDKKGNASKSDAHAVALSGDLDEKDVDGALGLYLKMCLVCVEYSGAAVIKLMQWAGSRPDMFGHDFCSVFSKLQDDTTPHAWRHTEKVLREAYGEDWRKRIIIRKGDILGSGCIGQVYKGQVLDKDGEQKTVAIKVTHPSVEANIDADLDLMRFFVRAIQKLPWDFFSNLKWLNMEGAVEDFADMLKLQLDCRVEAKNLERFNENFADSEFVVFPKLVDEFAPSKNVLIETFCEGVPVLKFAKEHKEEQELLTHMCFVAIEAVCKMIFLDNFMHGDLHPGNVLIDPVKKKFVLLDVGIVVAYTEEDHTTIVDVLTSFIRRKGRTAGRLMIDSSNRLLRESNDHAVDEERFLDKMEQVNIEATTQGYLMENLGYYITFICNAAAKHHVLLNQAFISSALAVKIQEGIALALDPSVKIYKVATPILYESERRRGNVKNAAMKILGLDKYFKSKADAA